MEELLQYKILRIGDYTLTVAMVLGVIITYVLSWLLLRTMKRGIHRHGNLIKVSDTGRRHSIFLIAQYFVWTISSAIMLEIVGIHVTVILAGSAALLVGVGLGLQQIFRDIMSGIFLLFEGTIEVGDVMRIDGEVGRVTDINLRTSELITRDGHVMIVPNHKFITENLVNWTHHDNRASAFSIKVGTNYAAPEDRVLEIMLECAGKHPDVLKNEPGMLPSARIAEFYDEKMSFELIFWTHRKFEADVVSADLRLAIRTQFHAEGIGMGK